MITLWDYKNGQDVIVFSEKPISASIRKCFSKGWNGNKFYVGKDRKTKRYRYVFRLYDDTEIKRLKEMEPECEIMAL